jgi:hypothetical protein
MAARSVDEFFGRIELRGPPESVISIRDRKSRLISDLLITDYFWRVDPFLRLICQTLTQLPPQKWTLTSISKKLSFKKAN